MCIGVATKNVYCLYWCIGVASQHSTFAYGPGADLQPILFHTRQNSLYNLALSSGIAKPSGPPRLRAWPTRLKSPSRSRGHCGRNLPVAAPVQHLLNVDSADKPYLVKNEHLNTPPKREGHSIKIAYRAF